MNQMTPPSRRDVAEQKETIARFWFHGQDALRGATNEIGHH